MSMTSQAASPHLPVMLNEVIAAFEPVGAGQFVDATVGAGGHAAAILERWPGSLLVAIDHDPSALEIARVRLADVADRVAFVRDNFRNLTAVFTALGLPGADGILMDLGVSSMHFDVPARGFSYSAPEAQLDMRMDPTQGPTAAELLNRLSQDELSRILRNYGEERWATRIAAFIVRERARSPMQTSGQLVEVIKAAIPASARRVGGHPARRVFQALRIAVNDELEALQSGLRAAADALLPGGRLVVISFHSLEDRIVKTFFRDLASSGDYALTPRKAVAPSEQEIAVNPRSRSAKLRVLARLHQHSDGGDQFST